MADRLKCTLTVLVWLGAANAQAQTALVDPTRPPPGIADPVTSEREVSGPVLESVLIPRKGRPLAVIGGQQVRLGQRYGESRLIRVDEREAVLEGPQGVERLLLTPDVEKKTASVGTNRARKAPVPRSAQGEGRP